MTKEQAISILEKDIENISYWMENNQLNKTMREEWGKRLEDIEGIKELIEGGIK